MEHPAKVKRETEPLGPTGQRPYNSTLQSLGDIADLHSNKHKEAAKMGRQRNMPQRNMDG